MEIKEKEEKKTLSDNTKTFIGNIVSWAIKDRRMP